MLRRICLIVGSGILFFLAAIPLSPAQNRTIMVIAPHEDDEALIGSGVVYAAKLRGDTVKVVLTTNGDYNGVSTGYMREANTVRAMSLLGLSEQDVIFLGYGDSLLRTLYQSSSDAMIYTSNAGMTHTYANRGLGGTDYHSYLAGQAADYTRANILSDFEAVLTNFQPDEVYTTSYLDGHDDHASTYLFIVEALLALNRAGMNLHTRVHDSMVWASFDTNNPWPAPGVTPTTPFTEPPSIDGGPYLWPSAEHIPVPVEMQNTDLGSNPKYQAIQQYSPNSFLNSFTKKDEFFWAHEFPTNLATVATVTVSSEDPANNRMNAVNGVIGSTGTTFAAEWVTNYEQSGAWIRLTWPDPVVISRVVLYDRPTNGAQILSGILSFSDGSSLPVGSLPDSGSAFPVAFPPKTVTYVQFTITNAVGWAPTGLNEIEVYGFPAASTADHSPQIASGPVPVQPDITDMQTTTLAVDAFDVDGDLLQYQWNSDIGTIDGTDTTVTFLPPAVISDTYATITVVVNDGRGGSATNTAFVGVHPSVVKVKSLSISPSTVEGGQSATATVTLGSMAPAEGTLVALTNDNPDVATVPGSVTVPQGATTATFAISTTAVLSPNTVTITAAAGGVTQSAQFTVTQPGVPVASLTLSPTSVPAGTPATGTVTLTGVAIGDGTLVALSSNDPSATVPGFVTVPGGASSATFRVNTTAVTASTTATISASSKGTTKTADLRVVQQIAPNLASTAAITVSTQVTGQPGTSAVDTLVDGYPWDYTREWSTNHELAGAWINLAWTTPVAVSKVVLYDRPNTTDNILAGTLSFSDGSTVAVGLMPANGAPLSISFPARTASWMKFTVTNAEGVDAGLAEIAAYGPSLSVQSLTLNNPTVVGGNPASATVTLSSVATDGGAIIALASSDPGSASVPPTVSVGAGSSTARFSISTSGVAETKQATLTASYNNSSQSATLSVSPAALASMTTDASTVNSGAAITGTVTLNGAASPAGAVLNLSSSSAALSLPPTVTVAPGAMSNTFTITAGQVSDVTTVVITASYNGGTQQANVSITPPAPTVVSIVLNYPAVTGGSTVAGTVTLSAMAPSGGAAVSLSSSNSGVAAVPATVLVPAGSLSAPFLVSTSAVSSATLVSVSAVTNGQSQTTNLTVNPPVPSQLTLSPTSVVGTNSSLGSVTLSGPAPAGGAIISLSVDNSAVTVPAAITVPSGSSTATFTATTTPVAATTTVLISVSLNGSTATAQLAVTPPVLSALTLNPASVPGGTASIATVQISAAAPTGGSTVVLASSNPTIAAIPASVRVPAGATTATVTITTAAVSATTSASITAVYGTTSSATLAVTIQSVSFSSIAVSPTSVRGGVSSTGTARLGTTAPAGGVLIALSRNNTAATVPSTVFIGAGATSATFTVTTVPVAATTTAVISGSYGTVTRNATLTINPAALSSVSLSPGNPYGGNPSTGTVTMTGPTVAPVIVALSSNNVATVVPASVTIAAGQTSATFTITTNAVLSNTAVTITASYAGVNRTATLNVRPATISSLTLTPSSVKGGSAATGTVVFSGIVPTNGTITLASSNTAYASVRSPIFGNGTNTVTFSITTYPVTTTRTPNISVSYLNSTSRKSLTITP